MLDAFDRDYDLALVISNDSDLVEPISVVRQRFGLVVGVVNPHANTSHALRQAASFYRPLRKGVLSSSQLADQLTDANGVITKPAGWSHVQEGKTRITRNFGASNQVSAPKPPLNQHGGETLTRTLE